MRKVILKHRLSPGDILTMTRAVGDLKKTYPNWKIDVRTPCPEIWENNPNLTPLNEDDEDVEVFDIQYPGINQSGWRGQHFTDAFRENIEDQLGVEIVKTGIKPDIHISDEEKGWINQVEVEFGWHGGFWLINAGWKPDNKLKYYHRWQEVADLFNARFGGAIRLVQVGHQSHNHKRLRGCYNLVGKTDLRQFIRLGWWAHGTIGPISFQFVLSAAFEQPHVVVAAGKEGVRWHIYPNGRYIYTNGTLQCCKWDGCWKGGQHGQCIDLLYDVPRCFHLIEPYMIVDAIERYYRGAVLELTRMK